MHKTDWMYEKKWGVFLHYLYSYMNNPENEKNMGKGETGWDECINDFDCDLFAKQLHEIGAGYLILTTQQQTKYFCAPNDTFNQMTGYQPGEACAKTDFIKKMADALEPYDISLLLYVTGDGPTHDEKAEKIFKTIRSTNGKVTREFVHKWSDVIKEYSLRYQDKIKGWWVDGCYANIGYDTKLLAILEEAVKLGNQNAVVAFNYRGCMDNYGVLYDDVPSPTPSCDYTAGELVQFGAIPFLNIMGKARWHVLSFLGVPKDNVEYNGWGASGSKYSGSWLNDYVKKVYHLGGMVTIDICAYRDGHIDPEQLSVLTSLSEI